MQFTTISAAAVLAFASYAQAGKASIEGSGKAVVVNNCGVPVYGRTTGDPEQGEPEIPTIMPGENHTQLFSHLFKEGFGNSIKLSFEKPGASRVTQFEYTVALDQDAPFQKWPMTFYDISNVDGNIFGPYGVMLEAEPGNKEAFAECACPTCPASDGDCDKDNAYTHPDDVGPTKGCDYQTTLTMTLCTDKPHQDAQQTADWKQYKSAMKHMQSHTKARRHTHHHGRRHRIVQSA